MPPRTILATVFLRSYRLRELVLPLTMVLLVSDAIHAATLSDLGKPSEPTEATRYSGSVVRADVDGAKVSDGRQLTLRPGLVLGTPMLPGKILKEIGKQAIDQPGHFLIAAVPIWASRCLVGVPWYGWVAAPLLAYREWLQWPSNRWWDPPLDWICLTLGGVVATFRRRPTYRLMDGLQPLRRGLSFVLMVGRRFSPAAT